MSRRHEELLGYATQRDTDATTAKNARDNSARGSLEHAVYDELWENARADAKNLRFQVADEKWRAAR
jgi:hypothetical protein